MFIGPCIAKKLEAAEHPELLDVALTFDDLRRWLTQEKIAPETLAPEAGDAFIPENAAEGAWYPVDGGMIAGMKSICAVNDCSFMAFSGINAIQKAIEGLGAQPAGRQPVPGVAGVRRRLRERPARRQTPRHRRQAPPGAAIRCRRPCPRSRGSPAWTSNRVSPWRPSRCSSSPTRKSGKPCAAVGKLTRDDELNCGGCGYDSCREFAGALIQQKAERAMCVTYMRKLALKKANALIQKMPSAVVIINDAMRIIEFNAAFATMFAGNVAPAGSPPAAASLEGVMLSEVMPFANLFHAVLKSGEDILDRDLRYQNTILHAGIFTIEKHCVVGGILQDITEPAVRKAEVIRKAQEVIQRSLQTTQTIACLLGESAAETEITLNSIIESFSPAKLEEPKHENDWRKLYRR